MSGGTVRSPGTALQFVPPPLLDPRSCRLPFVSLPHAASGQVLPRQALSRLAGRDGELRAGRPRRGAAGALQLFGFVSGSRWGGCGGSKRETERVFSVCSGGPCAGPGLRSRSGLSVAALPGTELLGVVRVPTHSSVAISSLSGHR